MPSKRLRALSLCLALGLGFAAGAQDQRSLAARPPARADQGPQPAAGPRLVFEAGASPLFSLGPPFRGGELSALCGLASRPFELGLRAAAAYDTGLSSWQARLDLCLGLGSGLRAIVGGLMLFGEPALPGGEDDAKLAATGTDWPNRFGIGARLMELGAPVLGGRAGLGAELVYTSYRLIAKSALSGAAAFAAGVEAKLELRIRWGP